ncbi:MAG: DUF5688 family protein [Lachnospiraceae bacterium]|nr:DUF5688 family protein [Lachnospiraceae bacterium]MDD3795428.1 DUF5688 family protein [Lachnospiraceae bacterium]
MRYEEFLEQVKVRIKKKIGKEVRICIYPVIKNNSIVLDGLSILQDGENISPAIYLNAFYREYTSGESLEHIIDKILCCYESGRKLHKIDTSFYTDFEKVRGKLVCRLINFEKNEKLLKEIPYHRFLNLAVVYYYLMDESEIGSATILVHNDHLKTWGVSADELKEIAVENTPKLLPWDFLSMSEMIHAMLVSEKKERKKDAGDCLRENMLEGLEELQPQLPLYILSNKEKNYGAVCMIYDRILESIADKLQDDYYILPSSVHECMIIPVCMDNDEEGLLEMVREINETQVEPEEILADSIYRYYRWQRLLRVVR